MVRSWSAGAGRAEPALLCPGLRAVAELSLQDPLNCLAFLLPLNLVILEGPTLLFHPQPSLYRCLHPSCTLNPQITRRCPWFLNFVLDRGKLRTLQVTSSFPKHPGARDSIQITHVGVPGAQRREPSPAASQAVHQQKVRIGSTALQNRLPASQAEAASIPSRG